MKNKKIAEHEDMVLLQFKSACKGKDFHGTKKKLYEQLIKSLRTYHASMSVEYRVNTLIYNAQLLFHKRLLQEAQVELNKAIFLAEIFELFLQLLYALELESKINLLNDFNFLPASDLHKKESKKEVVINQYRNYNQYINMEAHFVSLYAKYSFVRDREAKKAYKNFMRNSLLTKKNMALSVRAQLIKNNIYCGYYYAKCDFIRSNLYARKMTHDIESRPGFEELFISKYIISLGNSGKCLLHLKKHKEVRTIIEKLKEVNSKDKVLAGKAMELYTSFEIALLIDCGDYKAVILQMDQLESKSNKNYIKLSTEHQHVMLYNYIYAYFGIGNYKAALKLLQKLFSFPGIEKNQHIYYFAQLLNLIIHYEKSNSEHVEYKIKSIYKYFYSHQQLYKFESLILLLLREAIYTNNKKELIALFEKYKTQFEKLLNDPFEKIAIEFFDIISWLESKITKKSFVEIVREKWEKEQST